MNASTDRVAIEYLGTRKALRIPAEADKKESTCLCIDLFNLPAEYQDFNLIIQDLDCPIQNAQDLFNNEILLLNDKNET